MSDDQLQTANAAARRFVDSITMAWRDAIAAGLDPRRVWDASAIIESDFLEGQRDSVSARDILIAVCKVTGFSLELMRSPRPQARSVTLPRHVALTLAFKSPRATSVTVAKVFRCDTNTVFYARKRTLDRLSKNDPETARLYAAITVAAQVEARTRIEGILNASQH